MSSPGHLNSQFAVIDVNEIPYIEKIVVIKQKGEHTLEFDWECLSSEACEFEVFLNHNIVASFKDATNLVQRGVVHIDSCDCCEGKNLLKFQAVGDVACGLDNVQVSN